MSIVVTGGAGYIGSHIVRQLRERGDDVVVVDDLSTGLAHRVQGTPIVELDLAAPDADVALTETFRRVDARAVVHLAARKSVEESVRRPLWYYEQNMSGLAAVLTAVASTDVRAVVFSSSAAVYGDTAGGQVTEETPCAPVNPYGETKLAGEWLVRGLARATGVRAMSLRYFNVAGAAEPALADVGAANLIPIAVRSHRRGEPVPVFGTDHATPDGSGVRDYVHVSDVAGAHLAALDRLRGTDDALPDVLNIGTGTGASVLEVLAAMESELGTPVGRVVLPARAGDPASVVASPALATRTLGWTAVHGLREIVASALATQASGTPVEP